jgi:cytochrome c oxidase cbb3-type subunit II
MPFMMSDQIETLQVKDRDGVIWCHYHRPPAGDDQARTRGPRIDFIGEKYLQRWLDLGLVVEVGAEPEPNVLPLPQRPAMPPSATYRLTGAEALYVTGPDGQQQMHIRDASVAEATHGAQGPIIPWLSADQASLLQGFVEKIGAAPAPAALPSAVPESDSISQEAVDECQRALDRLGVPVDAGAPTARAALREAGESCSNATIALAVRSRKSMAGTAQ